MTTFMLPLSLVLEWMDGAECDNMQNCCHYHLFDTGGTCWTWQVTTFMLSLCLVLQWIYNSTECTRSHHSWCHYHFFVVVFNDLNILFTGTKISCTSSPVNEGETASVKCHFHSNLRETKNNFFVYRFKTDGKRRHGNTLNNNFFSTCKTMLKISTMPVLCILNQSVYLLGMTLGVSAWA